MKALQFFSSASFWADDRVEYRSITLIVGIHLQVTGLLNKVMSDLFRTIVLAPLGLTLASMLFRLPWQFAVSSDASLVAVLQVRLTPTLLTFKQCWGSVTFWCGAGSAGSGSGSKSGSDSFLQ
jgi:hypothetical protein